MSTPADPGGFGKFVPGFDFLQQLAKSGNASLAGWIAPTLDAQALDKRIEELKAVQFWLDQNATALKATIQALEVQKMTLATLRTMNVPMPAAAPAPAAAPQPAAPPARRTAGKTAGKSAPKPAPGPAPAAAVPDPMQFWGALTRQFQQIAADAMKDVATRKAAAPVPAGPAVKQPAPRSRKKA
jgi:hypothetical protein